MTTTQLTGWVLIAVLFSLLFYCMSKPREKITLKQFCQELWEGDPCPRWMYWVIVWFIIWKL